MIKNMPFFYQEDDHARGYYAGDLKPGWAITFMIALLVLTGYLEGQL